MIALDTNLEVFYQSARRKRWLKSLLLLCRWLVFAEQLPLHVSKNVGDNQWIGTRKFYGAVRLTVEMKARVLVMFKKLQQTLTKYCVSILFW